MQIHANIIMILNYMMAIIYGEILKMASSFHGLFNAYSKLPKKYVDTIPHAGTSHIENVTSNP